MDNAWQRRGENFQAPSARSAPVKSSGCCILHGFTAVTIVLSRVDEDE